MNALEVIEAGLAGLSADRLDMCEGASTDGHGRAPEEPLLRLPAIEQAAAWKPPAGRRQLAPCR